jgi:dimethylaniline monooxygenase (N-oxide forming)
MSKTIAIVGAGLSGLVTAKTLLEYGHRVTVFEKEAEIGGVWASSRAYPGLHTQNTRDSYAFTDYPMPRRFPEFPTGENMREYLHGYAEKFELFLHIELSTRVTAAEPATTGWLLTVQPAASAAITQRFDYLVVCNGTFSDPYIPPVDGLDAFMAAGGAVQHSTQVQAPDAYRAKRVAVVGFGKSACDVASSVAREAAETTIVYRQAKWKVPKRIMGINYKYIILSRFGEALTKLRYRTGVESAIHALKLPNAMFRFMEGVFTRQQRLKEAGLRPQAPITDLLFGELSVETDGFFRQVIDGDIRAVQAGVRSAEPGALFLTNGERLPVDVVVFGTGFSQSLPFLSADVRTAITDEYGNYELYRNILPLAVPNLAFVGYNTSFFCNLTSEMAALWLAEHLRGRIRLPPGERMRHELRDHMAWRLQFRRNALYKGASVYPFNIAYIDWLLEDMQAPLPLGKRLYEWMRLIDPSHYQGVKKKIRERTV